MRRFAVLVFPILGPVACGASDGGVAVVSAVASAPAAVASAPAGGSSAAEAEASAAPVATTSPVVEPASAPEACPDGMLAVPGGRVWLGDVNSASAHPRFEAELAPYCLDRTEVTVAAYRACVASGACEPATEKYPFCNTRFQDREDHPVNCVDHARAERFCASRGARLPTEAEWETAAKGGAEQRRFSWGSEPPDGRTCWKHPFGSCVVGSFPPGAYGLVDMTGNVWEFTSDWFGPYPWPALKGTAHVTRGGSWSRRFDKWMINVLRNRAEPAWLDESLGFRCALTPKGTRCPGGVESDGRCQLVVHQVQCLGATRWNGVRCAGGSEPRCPGGFTEVPGHGCTSAAGFPIPDTAVAEPDTPIAVSRSPEFDADCQKHKPGRPHAYRFSGGTNAARHTANRARGCLSRDVGAGWTSVCCP